MSIDFKCDEYMDNVDDWIKVDDVIEGNKNNKKRINNHIRFLNPDDKSAQNLKRNQQYRDSAVFYNVPKYTLDGYTSLMFNKHPKIDLPAQLEYLIDNANGAGVGLTQLAKTIAQEVTKKGRCGLFVSYPKTEGSVSRAQMANGFVSTIHQIDAERIINWRTKLVGSNVILTLVVISETVDKIDGYKTTKVQQYRELALENNIFIVREWQKDKAGDWTVVDESIPTNATGAPWTEIPFVFIGSSSNTHTVDQSPMLDLCSVSIGHYRNSADYEENLFYAGQAQPWMSGLTQSQVDMMKENKVYIGSRNLLSVPSGERFGFESAPERPSVLKGMEDKRDMMIALGARLIQETGKIKTATESSSDDTSRNSILIAIAQNVSDALTRAINFCGQYMGASTEAEYELSTNFVNPNATAQELQAMVSSFIQGAIPQSDYFRWLKQRDLVEPEKTLDDFNDELNINQI